MLWLLTLVTALVLAVIGLYVRDIGLTPTVTALSASTRTHSAPSAAGSAGHRVTPKQKASPSAGTADSGPRLTDAASGLSYQLLSAPWTSGCPSILNSSRFVWTAGEHAVAGPVTINGGTFDWHGNACSGQLQPHYAYAGPQDLRSTATNLVDALDPAYYTGLTHERTTQASSALAVSGHPAWMVRFLETYPDAIGEQLAWTSELAAVVVVDRGTGQVPAVFYVSVPANLGTQNVATLVGSLRLSAP